MLRPVFRDSERLEKILLGVMPEILFRERPHAEGTDHQDMPGIREEIPCTDEEKREDLLLKKVSGGRGEQEVETC